MKNTTVKKKKIPERRCTGCGESFPKKDLIRIVRSHEGEISLDFTGKKSGRGAYICPKSACFKKARRQGRIARSLESEISEELYEALCHEVEVSEKQAAERID